MKKLVLAGAMASLLASCAQQGPKEQNEQPLQQQQQTKPDEIREKMQWFADAKLGIFIHWGIYSVKGIDESWSFHNKKISHADYMSQMSGFTADKYDPQAWADLIAASGAKYAVITTKHHDGVALWDTKLNDLSTAKGTPAKRDVLTPSSRPSVNAASKRAHISR